MYRDFIFLMDEKLIMPDAHASAAVQLRTSLRLHQLLVGIRNHCQNDCGFDTEETEAENVCPPV